MELKQFDSLYKTNLVSTLILLFWKQKAAMFFKTVREYALVATDSELGLYYSCTMLYSSDKYIDKMKNEVLLHRKLVPVKKPSG